MYGQGNVDFSEGGNMLIEPGVYEGTLELVESRTTTGGYEVLAFVMKDKESGQEYAHLEFPQADDPVKIQNQQNRIGLIMSRFVDEQRIMNMSGVTDWDSYRRWVVNTLGNSYKNVPIKFKLVPDIYDPEKPRVKFPNYKGGLVAIDKPLALSQREKDECIRLKQLREKKANNSSPTTNDVSSQIDMTISDSDNESALY